MIAPSSLERRLLQLAIAIGCCSPLLIGGVGILRGPAAFGHPAQVPTDLDSHFRYLSGIFFATAFGFASCIPAIERQGPRFRLLGLLIVTGGLSRALSLASVGTPSLGHRIGLGVELGIVPLLLLWQWRLSRRA